MTSQRKIPRKPLPSNSIYVALLEAEINPHKADNTSLHLKVIPVTESSSLGVTTEHAIAQEFRPTETVNEEEQLMLAGAVKQPTLVQSEIFDDEKYPTSDSWMAETHRWKTSVWTSSAFLGFFVLLVAIVTVALVVLYQIANTDHAFHVDLHNSLSPFLWRYLPVAVFTLLTALWHQTDYHVKVAAPWLHMQRRFTPGRQSLLLDYNSPWLPVALHIATRHRDWLVIASSSAYSLLKLLVLLSTGLFTVQEVQLVLRKQNLPMVWSYNQVEFRGKYLPGPLDTYWGILNAGLQYPRGTNAIAAFPTFSKAEDFPGNATISAVVEAFFPTLECVVAESENVQKNLFRSWTDDCSIANYSTSFCETGQSVCTFQTSTRSLADDLKPRLSALSFPFVCGTTESDGITDGDEEVHFLMALIEAQNYTSHYVSAHVLASLICRPNYSLEKARLEFHNTNSVTSQSFHLSSPLTTTGNLIDGISPTKLVNLIFELTWGNGIGTVPDPAAPLMQSADPFFSLMLDAENQTDLEFFADPQKMATTGQAVYQGLAIQVANQWLAPNLSSIVIGNITFPQERLQLQASTVWLMCSSSVLLIICACIVGFLDREGRVHTAFGMHHWNLYILSSSENARHYMKRLGAASGRILDEQMSTVRLKTTKNTDNVMAMEIHKSAEHVDEVCCASNFRPWRPLGVQKKFIAGTTVLVISLIVSLEVIQRMSGRYGFVSVGSSPTLARAMATYLPAAVLLSTAALLGSLEFAVKVMAPFQSTSARGVPAESSIMFTAFHATPVSIYQSIRRKRYAVFLTTCCGLLAGIFTILSAGLYTIGDVPSLTETSFAVLGSFNLSQTLTDSVESNLFGSLLEYYNATYDQGTFADLVYPEISFRSSESHIDQLLQQNYSSVVVQTDVLRPVLDCAALSSNQLNVTREPNTTALKLIVTGDIPAQCRLAMFSNFTRFRVEIGALATSLNNSDSESYGGAMFWLEPDLTGLYEWNSMSYGYPSGCQSVGFVWGSWSNSSLDSGDFNLFTCTQRVEAIPASLKFSIPKLSLDLETPPVLNEALAHNVSTHQFESSYIGTTGLQAPFDCDLETSDAMFQAVTCGSMSKITKQDLGNPTKSEEVLRAVTYVYDVLVAQHINVYMRTDDGNSNVADVDLGTQVNATIEDSTTLRVFQNATSKVILQVVLVVALLCFIGAYALTDTELLPHDPMTIAGSMSLLAGSSLLDNAEHYQSFEEFEEKLRGKRFRHGWWGTGDTRWYGMGVVEQGDF